MNRHLFVLSSVIETWRKESKRYILKETGGILIGYTEKSGNLVITHATGPGPKAKHGFMFFEADHNYSQRLLNNVFEITQGELTFLGDWHTHPFGSLALSYRDAKTTKEMACDKRYQTSCPLIVIYKPRVQILNCFRQECFGAYLLNQKSNKIEELKCKIIKEIPNYSLPILTV